MIKIKYTVIALLISISGFAQLNKGQIMINGDVNYYSYNYNSNPTYYYQKSKQQGFGSNINVGYFLTNHFAVGISGSVYRSKSDNYRKDSMSIINSISKENSPSIGVFLRYNQPVHKSKFGFFLQLGSNYSFIKNEHKYDETYFKNYPNSSSLREEKGNSYRVNLKPGLFYFVNNRLSLEASLGNFSYYKSKITDVSEHTPYIPYTKKQSSFNSNFSISTFYLGVTFYLGKNKNAANESSAAETK